jgi:beta-glucanase (GH16 family)
METVRSRLRFFSTSEVLLTMLDPTVLRPSAGHDFRRLGLILLRKSAVVAVCVLLALVISLGAYGSKTISRADDVNACPVVQAVTDDFSGPAGAPPNQQLWSYQLGAGGSDGQLEAFTDSPRNASLDGNGNLAIVALNEPIDFPGAGVFNYTSAFLTTHGHLDACYGTVSARIKLPTGHGLRPAFWLSGSDFSTVGWPQCGEIDIFDSGLPKVVTSIHGPAGYDLPLDVPFDGGTGWHEYALSWRRDRITTSIDGKVLASWTPELLPPDSSWVFNDHPMYITLEIAVGAWWGVPDASTQFPATMLVDWMRYIPAT